MDKELKIQEYFRAILYPFVNIQTSGTATRIISEEETSIEYFQWQEQLTTHLVCPHQNHPARICAAAGRPGRLCGTDPNVEGSASNARYSLSQGVYYVAQVSNDREGVNVSSAASSGRGYVETLAGQLDSVRSNAEAGGGSLRSMKNGFGDIAGDADALVWQIRA